MGGEKAEEIEREGTVSKHQGEEGYEQRQAAATETTDEEDIEEIGHVFIDQRPLGNVEGEKFFIAANIIGGRLGNHQEAEDDVEEELPNGGGGDAGIVVAGLEIEEGCSEQDAEEHHGLKTNEANLAEIPARHLAALKPGIIGITDDETGEDEEEIDGEEAVVEVLIDGVVGEGFAEMEDDDHQGSYTAKTIENIETGLGRGGTHKNLSGI